MRPPLLARARLAHTLVWALVVATPALAQTQDDLFNDAEVRISS